MGPSDQIGANGAPSVLLVNHTSAMSGAEVSLVDLIEGLPPTLCVSQHAGAPRQQEPVRERGPLREGRGRKERRAEHQGASHGHLRYCVKTWRKVGVELRPSLTSTWKM